jgi:hypothetical protein
MYSLVLVYHKQMKKKNIHINESDFEKRNFLA